MALLQAKAESSFSLGLALWVELKAPWKVLPREAPPMELPAYPGSWSGRGPFPELSRLLRKDQCTSSVQCSYSDSRKQEKYHSEGKPGLMWPVVVLGPQQSLPVSQGQVGADPLLFLPSTVLVSPQAIGLGSSWGCFIFACLFFLLS